MKIKFMCPECQHCEPESTADNVKTFIVSVFFFVGVLSVSTFVIMSSLVGPQVLIGHSMSFVMGYQGYAQNDFSRELALNLTMNCSQGDQACETGKVWDYMKEFKYVLPPPGVMHDFEFLHKTKATDCKGGSRFMNSLLTNIGINSFFECNLKKHHCIIVATIDDSKILFDPANDFSVFLKEGQDPWSFYDHENGRLRIGDGREYK